MHRAGPFACALLVVGADLAASLWLGDPIYRLPMRYGVLRALPLFLLGVAAAFYGSRVYVASRLAGAIGVGAAIAPGSQKCAGAIADFVSAPAKMSTMATVTRSRGIRVPRRVAVEAGSPAVCRRKYESVA